MHRLSRGALPRLRGRLRRVALAPEARLRSFYVFLRVFAGILGYWLYRETLSWQPMPNARLIQQDIAVIHAAIQQDVSPERFAIELASGERIRSRPPIRKRSTFSANARKLTINL